MGRDGDGLHAALILHPIIVYFRKDNGKSDPLAGADVLHSDIDLNDSAQGLQPGIPQVHQNGIGAAVNREIYRLGALLRIDHNTAIYGYGRIREGDLIPLCIGIGDRLIDLLGTRGLSGVADKELQRGAL